MDALHTRAFRSDGAASMGMPLSCPTCDTPLDNVHLGGLRVDQDGDRVLVRRGEVATDIWPPGRLRGSRVVLALWCEAGHRFALAFQFHKGSTFVQTWDGPDFNPEEEYPEELWRD
jgi:hypothetical protein